MFDLDDTLADTTHRAHLIEGDEKNWGAYFAACGEDTPIQPMCNLFQRLQHSPYVRLEIWTGRSEDVLALTATWLADRSLFPHRLRMRPAKERCSNAELKANWLTDCGADKPDLAFDDNLNTIAWWRRQGVFAAAVADNVY